MSEVYISKKSFYDTPLGDGKPVVPEMRRDCYAVFACRHKFCRDVCPVYFETRDETTGSYGLHTSILGMAEGYVSLSDLQETITMCLECGACELRCPNSLYTGDFYGQSTTLVDLVRKVRRDLIAQGTPPTSWESIQKYIDQDIEKESGPSAELVKWADDLDLPHTGETMLFVDYFNAGQTTDVPRNAVKILKSAGIRFGIPEKPYPTLGELYESDKEKWLSYASQNIDALAKAGAKTVILVNPHDFIFFVREYPKYFNLPFDVVYITDYLLGLLEAGKITLKNEIPINATYHDPCSLNKHVLNWEAPRTLIKAIPGVNYKADDHIRQWDYCCGNGLNSFKRLKPDISYKIGLRRFSMAEEVGAEQLIVACPHCLDQFTEVKAKSGSNLEPVHILELIVKSMGID